MFAKHQFFDACMYLLLIVLRCEIYFVLGSVAKIFECCKHSQKTIRKENTGNVVKNAWIS